MARLEEEELISSAQMLVSSMTTRLEEKEQCLWRSIVDHIPTSTATAKDDERMSKKIKKVSDNKESALLMTKNVLSSTKNVSAENISTENILIENASPKENRSKKVKMKPPAGKV